jgi:Asp-tRNA(Asn)/Glu-tRNA(Gln) amidotransferase A subunit family amidase
VNIPLGVDANGLPMGLQLAARQGQDALLLSLARTIEEAMPWAARTSPVFREA